MSATGNRTATNRLSAGPGSTNRSVGRAALIDGEAFPRGAGDLDRAYRHLSFIQSPVSKSSVAHCWLWPPQPSWELANSQLQISAPEVVAMQMDTADRTDRLVAGDRQEVVVKSPATGDVVGTVPLSTNDEVKAVAARLRGVQPAWQKMGVQQRARWAGQVA